MSYTVTKRPDTYYDVLDQDRNRINKKRLSRSAAQALADAQTVTGANAAVETAPAPANVLTWEGPIQAAFEGNGSHFDVWTTACGRYRIARCNGGDPRFAALVAIDAPGAKERVIADDLKNLQKAMDAVEAYHAGQTGEETESNGAKILAEAKENGLYKTVKINTVTNTGTTSEPGDNSQTGGSEMTETKMFEVEEKAARDMLAAAGFTAAKTCPNKKLVNRLNRLDKNLDVLNEPDGDAERKLFHKCLRAIEAGTPIGLEGMVPAETNGKASKAAKNGTPKAPRQKADVDKFGCRAGSQAATINAVFGKKPKTAADIVAETGLSKARVMSHAKWLIERKHIVSSDKGYAVA